MSATANVLALPAHVSPSQISTWHQCGRQYLLGRVMKLPEEPMGHFIGGGAVHTAIELQLKGEARTFEDIFSDLVAEKGGIQAITWRGRRTKAFPGGDDPTFWLAEGPKMVDRALMIVEAHLGNGFEIADIEARYTPEIAGRRFDCRADIVFKHPEGTWLVTDWKTGASSPGDFAPLQLCYYALALEQTYGAEVSQVVGQVAMLRKDVSQAVTTYSPSVYVDLARQLVTDFTAGTEAGVWPMRISSLCKACAVRAHCDYGKTLDNQGGDE